MVEIHLSVPDWSMSDSSWFICLKPSMEESSSSLIPGCWNGKGSRVSSRKQSSTPSLHTKIYKNDN